MWEELIAKIKSLISNIDGIKEVYEYEAERFSDSPVVTITPSSNEADYITTDENVRIYAFNIRIHVNRNNAPDGEDVEKYADEILRARVTDVIDTLDKNYTLSGISEPTGYTFINVFAVPSTWGYVNREVEYRVAEVNARCRVSVDLNNI